MKNFLLAVCVLLSCMHASHAQVEYPTVPLDDPAYSDIYILLHIGNVEYGWPDSVPNQAMTRYEFAVVTGRLLEHINVSTVGKDNLLTLGAANTYSTNIEAVAALRRLANEFLPEIKAVGYEIEQVKINDVYLIENPSTPIAPQVADKSPIVPLEDSVYTDVDTLSTRGVFTDCPFEVSGNMGMTRYQFAIFTARLLPDSPVGPWDKKVLDFFKPNGKKRCCLSSYKTTIRKISPRIEGIRIQGERD